MFITNNPELAKRLNEAGVERIFVDWEVNGKLARQGHLDTVISGHTPEDAKLVRQAVPNAELLIRINPFYNGTEREIQQAIDIGADLIMLPMFRTYEEVQKTVEFINGRARFVPLFETVAGLECYKDIIELKGVYEIYVGLNDLHLELNHKFMFEPLVQGLLEDIAMDTKGKGLKFGFGGIARVNEGLISGSMVLSEHARLHSDIVILSRTFYRPDEENTQAYSIFRDEIKLLRHEENIMINRTVDKVRADSVKFRNAVAFVVAARTKKIETLKAVLST